MIAAMDRVEVVFLQSELQRMIPFLQEAGVVHIEDVPLAMENHPGFLHRVHLPRERQQELESLEEVQRKAREAIPLLSSAPSPEELTAASRNYAEAAPGLQTASRAVQYCHRRLRSLARRRLNIEDNQEVLRNYRHVLRIVAPLLTERHVLLGVTAKAIIVATRNGDTLDKLDKQIIQDVGPECDMLRRALDRTNTVAVITHPAGRGAAVAELLQASGIVPLEVPDKALRGITVDDALNRIEDLLRGFEAKLEALASERAEFSQVHGADLCTLERAVTDRIAQLRVVCSFAESKLVAVVHGWIPRDTYGTFSQAIRAHFGDRAVVDRLPNTDVDRKRIPTLLRNRGIFKPFELILRIFDPPRYGTFDPTWIVAVAFVLFYGFILGDAGYGLLFIGVAAWAKRRWGHRELVRDALTIAQWMGASSIVWGVVFGEFFGNLPELYLGIEPLFHRMHQPLLLLCIAIGYGLIHVPVSLVIGVIEGYRHGHREHAEEKLGMLLGLMAVIVGVAGVLGFFPGGATAGAIAAAVLFVAALGLLIHAMGAMAAMGVMEIIGLTSNVLSYGRLMALGLASVVLADLANKTLSMPGAAGIVVGIPLAGVIHFLNIGIGAFSPTIHSLRLNYVEFLPKFYEPEGRNYQPFRKELLW
ncbi:MAG: hypothetical protein KA184_13140 [Candidatus Hydrogenedentes bacterium]|nr:hypothetical protein [Candidatus Hydrogenedentota bacterium]